jgi:hypothetical protein
MWRPWTPDSDKAAVIRLMTHRLAIVTNITSLFRKSIRRGDGETLAFLAVALKRVIANDYREMLLGQAQEIERRLSEVDRVLTASDRCPTMNGLVEKIDAVHLSLVELLSILANPVHSIDPEKRWPRNG